LVNGKAQGKTACITPILTRDLPKPWVAVHNPSSFNRSSDNASMKRLRPVLLMLGRKAQSAQVPCHG
jgi:hypothetical protein